jgi:hypothetical protein
LLQNRTSLFALDRIFLSRSRIILGIPPWNSGDSIFN